MDGRGSPSDGTAPETTIDAGPPLTTAATEATFEFTSSEPGPAFECRTDGGAWAPCTSPISYEALTAGPHSFDVRATDAASNTDPTPAGWAWSVQEEGAAQPAPITSLQSTAPSPGGATAVADSTPPAFEVRSGRKVGNGRRLIVEVSCTSEPCTAIARGRVIVARAARTFALAPVVARLAPGARARLALRLSKSASRVMRRALRRRASVPPRWSSRRPTSPATRPRRGARSGCGPDHGRSGPVSITCART